MRYTRFPPPFYSIPLLLPTHPTPLRERLHALLFCHWQAVLIRWSDRLPWLKSACMHVRLVLKRGCVGTSLWFMEIALGVFIYTFCFGAPNNDDDCDWRTYIWKCFSWARKWFTPCLLNWDSIFRIIGFRCKAKVAFQHTFTHARSRSSGSQPIVQGSSEKCSLVSQFWVWVWDIFRCLQKPKHSKYSAGTNDNFFF